MAEVACPFCGVTSPEPLAIEAHIEENHANEGSLGNAYKTAPDRAAPPESDLVQMSEIGGDYVKCTRQACGEYILITDIDEHLAVHASIAGSEGRNGGGIDLQEIAAPRKQSAQQQAKLEPSSHRKGPSSRQREAPTLLEYFSGRSVPAPSQNHRPRPPLPTGRLGRRELGPHAFEKQMPDSVRRRLLNDARPYTVNKIARDGGLTKHRVADNETADLIPLLANLCAHDPDTKVTYLCHPAIKHIRKLRCDGNFCGFWNIQMMLTYLRGTRTLQDMRQIPDVLQIQDTIEAAWENNILPHGRTETGGIRGTRKWIGTSEAVACFTQIGVAVEAFTFQDDQDELAVVALLDHIEAHFIDGQGTAQRRGKSCLTTMAPIYFQRRGHSMTIVGLVKNKDGSRDLLLFDPSFDTAPAIWTLLGGELSGSQLGTLLRPYRRSDQSLGRWDEFEIVVPTARAADQASGGRSGSA